MEWNRREHADLKCTVTKFYSVKVKLSELSKGHVFTNVCTELENV